MAFARRANFPGEGLLFMKKASKPAPKALGKKAPTAKKSPTKPKPRKTQGEAELAPIVERLAQSAERLPQAA
jgi:hypothetical protein